MKEPIEFTMIANSPAIDSSRPDSSSNGTAVEGGLDERRRIAQELHDGLGCTLALAQLLSDALPNKDCTRARELRSLLRQAQWELRALLNNLVPEFLLQQGLASAIRQLVERCNRYANVELKLELPDSNALWNSLATGLQIHIFRLVQELLHNAIQHSDTPQGTLSFHFQNTHLLLRFEDGGRAMPSDAVPFFLRERVLTLGGELRLKQRKDGKEIHLLIPLKAEQPNTHSKNESRENCRP